MDVICGSFDIFDLSQLVPSTTYNTPSLEAHWNVCVILPAVCCFVSHQHNSLELQYFKDLPISDQMCDYTVPGSLLLDQPS
jgi:hypothetical protein